LAFFLAFLKESVHLWVQMSPYLLLGMLIGGALHVMLREEFILRHLGGRSSSSVFKATLFGIPLPLCSCGVIPVAASLRRDGASKGATLAFLVSTPTTGVDSILATYSLLGPLFAFFRPLAALLAGLVVGLSSLFVVKEERWQGHRHPLPSRQPMPERLKEGLRYGLLELSRDIGGWLLLGVIVGGALSALVPESAFRSLGVHPLWESLALLALSIPLYVCATGSIPVAAALITKGISPGAALVFLVAGLRHLRGLHPLHLLALGMGAQCAVASPRGPSGTGRTEGWAVADLAEGRGRGDIARVGALHPVGDDPQVRDRTPQGDVGMIKHFLTVGSRSMPLFCAERNERDLVIFQSRFINDGVL